MASNDGFQSLYYFRLFGFDNNGTEARGKPFKRIIIGHGKKNQQKVCTTKKNS